MSEYKIHKAWIEEAEFEILVIEYPNDKDEVEDKLAYLAREKGNIPKSFYEDFVIVTCVANINQLIFHIKQQQTSNKELTDVRAKVMDKIVEINPLFSPENLVINRNSVVKVCLVDQELSEDSRRLKNNKFWETPYYDDNIGNQNYSLYKEDTYDEGPVDATADSPVKTPPKTVDSLSHSVDKKWWKRINKYINIRKFKEEDMKEILKQRFFHDRSSFQTYIVSVCVVDSESLFVMLDTMGIPNNTPPIVLMHEIYELCLGVNAFLTYENAQDNVADDEEEDTPSCKTPPSRMKSHANQNKRKTKKLKKKFKDVPKEDLLRLADTMKVFVIGQDAAIDNVVKAVQRASVGLKDPDKPIGSFLFAGRTGCGKCVEKGTLTFSEQGIKPIDAFCGVDKISELCVDVYGINGPNKTSHIYREGIKPGRRLTTDNGYELGGSMIHPLITINDKGIVEFKEVSELTTDDYVAIQYNQNYFSLTNKEIEFKFVKKAHDTRSIEYRFPEEMNEELAYYLGMLLGDGGLTIDRTINFTNKDKQLVKTFFDLSKKLFGITPRHRADKYSYGFNSRHIYDFIEQGCGVLMTKSPLKRIPSIILESRKDCIQSFIRGIMDTDGYFEKGPGSVAITLSSREMIKQLQTVLLNFGIVSSIRHRLVKYNDGFNNAWELKINGSYAKRYFKEIGFNLNEKKGVENLILHKINNTNKDTIPNIHNIIYELVSTYRLDRSFHKNYRGYYKGYRKPSRKKLVEILNVLYTKVGSKIKDNILFQYLTNLSLENIFWSKIAKIDYVEEMELYDFTVPKTHTFISNGFISHNTLVSKVLADELIKDKNNLVTIDCSEYSADHEYAKLIGAPAGYIGHESGGILTNAIAENPFSIVVFDEVEKASSKVHELMLQILEEGRLTDGKGQKVSFKDAIIIMTSNVGVKEVDDVKRTVGFGDVAKLTEERKVKSIDQAIKKKFKPEFINRIDDIVHFNNLTKNDYMRIIDIELYKLNENLRNNDTEYKDITLEFDKRVQNLIYKEGINEDFGARPLKRCIEKKVSDKLAEALLTEAIPVKSKVKVSVYKNDIVFKHDSKAVNEEVVCVNTAEGF